MGSFQHILHFNVPLHFHVLVSQEATEPEPPQNNRARRSRVRRVWNGEAFVPEVCEIIRTIYVKWLIYTVECALI